MVLRDTIRTLALSALIFLFTFAVYSKSLRNDFIWEDKERILFNASLKDLNGLKRIWTDPRSTFQYYPITHTAFWLEYRIFKTHPFGYHLVNILLHALNAGVLFILLKRLKLKAAFFAALIFAAHPIQVESVAWVCELKNILCGLFFMLSVMVYLKYKQPEDGQASKCRDYFCSLILFLAAVLSKTVACMAPVVMALVVFWKKGRLSRRDLMELIPFLIIGLMAALLTIRLEQVIGAAGEDWDFTFFQRVLIATKALIFYPYKLLWPYELTFFYPKWDLSGASWENYFSLVCVVLAIAGLFNPKTKSAGIAFVLYGTIIFPALGFFNMYPMRFSFVADHFQYLAGIPLMVLFAECVYRIFTRIHKAFPPIVLTSLIVFLGYLSFQQSMIYRDDQTLFSDVIEKNPSSSHAQNNLGVYFMEKGQYKEAVPCFQKALGLDPHYQKAKMNLAFAYQKTGNPAAAYRLFQELKKRKSSEQ